MELVHPGRAVSMKSRSSNFAVVLLTLALGILAPRSRAAESRGATNMFPTELLSLADAVNMALRQSPAILKGKKDLEATQGVVVQTRAVALPKIKASGNYSAYEPS